MKAIVILLALLAAAKLGYQEYLFRAPARRPRRRLQGARDAAGRRRIARTQTLGMGAQAWANPKAIRLVIGKSSIDVYPWQVDDPMWNARYRNPYLLLTTSQRTATVSCEYDITNAAASVSRM